MKSHSRETFGQKCDQIHLLSLTQIDLDIGPTTGPDFKLVLPLGTGRTAALRCVLSPRVAPSTLLDGTAKVTVVGNLGLTALSKIL